MASNLDDIIQLEINKTLTLLQKLSNDSEMRALLTQLVHLWVSTLQSGGKIILAGNGGSAADCQHIAAELVSRFNYDRPGLAGIALTVDTSVLTAIGNDYGFEKIFSRQLEAIVNKNDLFVAISTSGNSENIIQALQYCKEQNINTVGMTGKSGGKMNEYCDHIIKIPHTETPKIQEAHMVCAHIICGLVESIIYPKVDAP